MKLYTQAEATEKFGLSRRSLIRYEEDGLIEPVRTSGGQRRYPETELLWLYGLEAKTKEFESRAGLYSRVSTRRQADAGNLERQTQRLGEYARAAGYEIVGVYEEIAGGLNESRRQLRKLTKAIVAGKINIVVVDSNSHFSVITTLCRFVVVTLVAGYAAVTTEVVTTTPIMRIAGLWNTKTDLPVSGMSILSFCVNPTGRELKPSRKKHPKTKMRSWSKI